MTTGTGDDDDNDITMNDTNSIFIITIKYLRLKDLR